MNISVNNVVKTFGSTNVIDGISMELRSGRVYGFQGINGCGKTMLMRLISGLIHPSKGHILVDGKELGGENSFPKKMGLLIENPSFLNSYSGCKNLEMLATMVKAPKGRENSALFSGSYQSYNRREPD